jgi:phage terminase large subunit-like protein
MRAAVASAVKPKKKTKHRDHAKIAAAFAASVLDGSFPAGKLLVAAVKRQEADLARQGTPGFGYVYDPKEGSRACRFLEMLPHVEGPLTGQKAILEPWQIWAVFSAYSWVSKVSKMPRFRRITIFLTKGSGKTFLAAGLALYCLATGTHGEKVFSAATTREQAGLSFTTARMMLSLAPDVRDHYGLVVEQHRIYKPESNATYRPVSSEAGSVEGLLPAFIVEDEIHAHKTRDLHDNLRSGAAKLPYSRQVVISTAGFDMSPKAIGYEVYCYARDILLGAVTDDSQFALLIEADRELDAWDPVTWRQANPNIGVSIDEVEVANEANEAKQVASKQPSFFTKRLGWWVESSSSWMDRAAWDRCLDPELKRERFDGQPCYIGLDMASTGDLTARVNVFTETGDDGERHYFSFCHAYLPEESPTLRKGNDALRGWARDGFLTLDRGGKLNGNIVRDDILADGERNPGSELCYDDRYATQVATDVDPIVTPIKIRQGATTQSAPMMELEAAIQQGRFHHDGNPVLTWCIGNVVVKPDRNGNIAPNKEGEARKIDAAVALINAMVRAMLGGEQTYSAGEGLLEV